MVAVTARQIEAARPGEVLWDDKIRGLHVRVFPTKRTFYLYYRTKQRQERRPKLGDYGILTIPAARDIARERLAEVAQGKDPGAASDRHTFEDLECRFLEVHGSKRKAKTQEMYRTAFAHAAKLRPASVASISRGDIADLHHGMRAMPVQANRVLAVLHKAFNLAEVWGWRPIHSNPVHGIDRNREKKRRRYPSTEEARRLFSALDGFDHQVFAGYVWLLVLTGARPGEIRTARREWVQKDGLHLPDSKGGEAVVVLPKAAQDVIKRLPVIVGNPHLIPGAREGQPLVGTLKLWGRLLKEAKVDGLQMRDLRRYFASLGLSAGLTLEAVGQLLRHRQTQTTKTYAYLLNDAANRAAEATAAELIRVRTSWRHSSVVSRTTSRRP